MQTASWPHHDSCYTSLVRFLGRSQDLIEAEQDNYGDLNIEYMTGRSLDDGLEESVSGEIFLFVATCMLNDRLRWREVYSGC